LHECIAAALKRIKSFYEKLAFEAACVEIRDILHTTKEDAKPGPGRKLRNDLSCAEKKLPTDS
jgi:hypothetical protein